MPRPVETAFVRISAQGLRKTEKLLDIDQKFIRQRVQEVIEEVGIVAVDILQDNAPERTGRLKESIGITGRNRSTFRPNIRVGTRGVSDKGFDYTDVTRFGRRAIEALSTRENFRPEAGRGGGRLARSYNIKAGSPGDQKRPFRAHMLSFDPGPLGGPTIYRRRVRAYRPRRDWVRASQDDIKGMTEYAFRKVTRDIEMILERPGGTPPRSAGVSIRSRFGKFSS